MGAWGVDILQNDTTADVWTEFKDLYNKGKDPVEIRKQLEKEYKPHRDEEYYTEIWTGIAHGQWMCGGLEDYTVEKIKAGLTEPKYYVLWEDDSKLLEKRKKAVHNFLQKIQTPRPQALKRKKVVERLPFFDRGDVISFQVDENRYAAAIVINRNDHPNYAENCIVFTDLLKERIEMEDVLNANILYLDMGGYNRYYRGYFMASFTAKNMIKKIKLAQKIGELKRAEYLSIGIGIPVGDWNKMADLIKEQHAYIATHKSDAPLTVSVQTFLQPDETLEWKLIDWDKKIMMEHARSQHQPK